MSKIPVRIASMGPADHGKSTLFGRVVLNFINDDEYWEEIDNLANSHTWFRPDRAYTYMFDRTLEERIGHSSEKGKFQFKGASHISTHVQCNIGSKDFLFIDVPGHDAFINNATAGIFQAQKGVLVISATDIDDVVQVFIDKETYPYQYINHSNFSKRKISHIFLSPILARVYGIDELIVVISKMDLVDFDQHYYQRAVDDLLPRLYRYSGLDNGKINVIPTSIDVVHRSDINVINPIDKSHPMAWYKGPSFISVLTEMIPSEPSVGNLLIPVETVYLKRIHESPLILTGRIMRGIASKGKEVQVIPLFDGSTEIHHPKKINGRIKSIRSRATSHQLPWIGEISTDEQKDDDAFEAGHVVGISLHLNPKYSWVKNDEGYFRKGCIITEINENIEMGTVLNAEVFTPFYSRLLKPGENWVVYLFGKNKGDALILSSIYEDEPFINETGKEIAGYLVKLQLLLNFTMAYPADLNSSTKYQKDIVLRHHDSFCGGKINNLCFPDKLDLIYTNTSNSYDTTELRNIFDNLSRLNKISCEWEIIHMDNNSIKVCIFHPSITEIIIVYQRLVHYFGDLTQLGVTINNE